MSIGTGIFLSSLLLAIVILYGITKDRWAWRRIVKRTVLALVGLIFLGALAGAGFYAWEQIPVRLQQQTKYANVRIGMSQDEVNYVKGYPPQVQGPAETEGDLKGWKIIVETKNLKKGKSIKDYVDWTYKSSSYRVSVEFDPKEKAVIAVECYSKDNWHRCPTIAGIADGDSEQEVIRKFGQPDSSEISGRTKSLYYSKIGVFFRLVQERVYMLGINDTRYRKR